MFDLNWAFLANSVTSVGFLNIGYCMPNHVFVVKWVGRLLQALSVGFSTWLISLPLPFNAMLHH